MLEFGCVVQVARAPVASATPPPVMFAVFTSVQLAVALLFHRQRELLIIPQSGRIRFALCLSCSTGVRAPAGEGRASIGRRAVDLRKPRNAARSRGADSLSRSA